MIRCDPELQCITERCIADQLKAVWEHRIQKQFGKKKKKLTENTLPFFSYLNRGEFCCYYRLLDYHELNNLCFKINYIIHHTKQKQLTYKYSSCSPQIIHCNVFFTVPCNCFALCTEKLQCCLYNYSCSNHRTERCKKKFKYGTNKYLGVKISTATDMHIHSS